MTGEAALYVHWPFCSSKCPYCDFNSHVADAVDQDRWRRALVAEIAHWAEAAPGRTITSMFFGGGTPSLMAADTVGAVIDAVGAQWRWAEDPEITLEANPSSAAVGKFRDFRAAGINRLSLGVQSLNDAALAFLGRRHDAAEARRALDAAASVFSRYTFDMIYGLPGQTPASWRDELTRVLGLAGGHLSVYQLTIEPGTAFFRDGVKAAGDDLAADLFELTRVILAEAGLPAYEVSNHARPGEESRHNLTYWRGGEYIGAGPGAHGRLKTVDGPVATHQIHDPGRWLAQVETRGHGDAKRRALTGAERAEEMVMTGLRLSEGLDTMHLGTACGIEFDQIVDRARLAQCLDGGLLRWSGRRLVATARGVPRLNAILAALLAPDGAEG